MGNPTTINVKAVDFEAWDKARNSANKQGETMGIWLSRALITQVNLEAGPREFPPDSSANPGRKSANPPLTPEQLTDRMNATAAMMQGLAAIKAATGKATGLRTVARALAAFEQRQIEAEGVPPARLVGKAIGKEYPPSLVIQNEF